MEQKRAHYPPLEPVPTGLKGRCPRCGEGALFSGFLTVKPQCSACQMPFNFEDSGDGPAIFIVMGLSLIVMGLALWLEFTYFPPWWVHLLLWPALILALGLPMLRMLKGVLISLQWHHDAASGRIDKTES